METPGEQPGAIERPEIGDLLHHAEQVSSRRGSAQTPHGSDVSTLPQIEQVESRSFTRSSARSSGASAASRFLSRWSTARRAERGPSPGSRASAWVSALDFGRGHGQ